MESRILFLKRFESNVTKDQVTLRGNELKIIRSLMYGMVRAGGTECTIKELEGAIAINEIVSAYETVMDVFVNGNFQQKDLETVKATEKSKQAQPKSKQAEEIEIPWDFYLNVTMDLFGWDVNFYELYAKFLVKSSSFLLRRNNPDAFEFEQNDRIYTMDQTPF